MRRHALPLKSNQQGFTLAELLIVVAIILVLVAVAVPVFTSHLEKSREATDVANIRAQYAEVLAEAIATGGSVNDQPAGAASNQAQFEPIQLQQKKDGWQDSSIQGTLEALGQVDGEPQQGGIAWVSCEDGTATIHFGAGSGGSQTSPAVAINDALAAAGIMETYADRTGAGEWTGPKAAVSAVGFGNSQTVDDRKFFPTTLKNHLGDTFSYEVQKGDGVRYVYITTDGIYNKADKGVAGVNVVRYTYDYSAGHTSQSSTRLLSVEYGTADINGKGFENFKVTGA